MHEKCTIEMFNQGIDVCSLCRAPIMALVSDTLPDDSPKDSEEASADAHPETPKAPEE
jgi:hypothetical protein